MCLGVNRKCVMNQNISESRQHGIEVNRKHVMNQEFDNHVLTNIFQYKSIESTYYISCLVISFGNFDREIPFSLK